MSYPRSSPSLTTSVREFTIYRSFPVPPISVLMPPPPFKVSLPAPPFRMLFPPVPVSTLSPALPVRESPLLSADASTLSAVVPVVSPAAFAITTLSTPVTCA